MIHVIKANGDKESFSEEKVRQSMTRAGVPPSLQEKILLHLRDRLYDGIQTWEVFQHINEFLGKSPFPYSRAMYSLKQSIMMLGPTGYPFEDFVSQILTAHGYSTSVRQTLSGKCITHEVDVIAEKDAKRIFIEAKFHNNAGARSDVHVAMYTNARYLDLRVKNTLDEGWLVTNTKVTTDAIAYAQCEGLQVIGWSYPDGDSLRDLIESANLHPITILTTLSSAQKASLLQHHVVLCKEICSNSELLNTLALSAEEKSAVLKETAFICKNEMSS